MFDFEYVVQKILGSWSGLQYAIDEGSGGRDTKQKADWLSQVLFQYFTENADLEPFEVEEWLCHILWNDFNLSLEDGSALHTATFLCQSYEFIKKCDESKLILLLAKLPAVAGKVTSADINQVHSSSSEDEPETISATASVTNGDNTCEQTMDVDDGWTLVTSKRR